MVENFEEITEPLTAEDEAALPVIIRGLSTHSKANPIKGPAIVAAINGQLEKYGLKRKFTEARLRKIVNHIRVNSLLAVMATSNGYYVTDDPEEIRSQVRSLQDRAAGILAAADGLKALIPKPIQGKMQFNS